MPDCCRVNRVEARGTPKSVLDCRYNQHRVIEIQAERNSGESAARNPLQVVFARLSAALPNSHAALFLRDKEREEFVLQGSSMGKHSFLQAIPAAVLASIPSLEGDDADAVVLAKRQAAKFLTKSGGAAGGSIVFRPLNTGERETGFLVAELGSNQSDEPNARTFLDLAAGFIQSSMDLSSDLKLAQAEYTFLSHLVSQAEFIDISSASETLITLLVSEIDTVLTYDRLTVCIQQPDVTDRLVIEWARGSEKDPGVGFSFDLGNVIHGEILSKAQPIMIGHLPDSGFTGRFVPGDIKKAPYRSFLGVPIMEAGIARGTLALESKEAHHFVPADLEALRATAQVYGTAFFWSRKYQEVHAMATIDGLTQLANHRFFLDRMEEELERASRYGETMTFLMLDLDHFKGINDTHGHLFGDYMLTQTAQLVRAGIRKPDVAGRYGGEEFSVIIINTTTQTSLTTAERIRSSIAGYKFREGETEARISVSIGMSEYPDDGQDVPSLIQCADEAMYRVKRQGGNGVISYSQKEGPTRKENP